MKRAVIAGYSRSPFTMARKGELIDVKPVNMFAEVVKNLVSKTKVNPADIEDIVVGCAFQVGEQSFNIGKLTTFLSGMEIHTSGMTVDRWCGSSMEAIHVAAGKIAMGAGKVLFQLTIYFMKSILALIILACLAVSLIIISPLWIFTSIYNRSME